MVIDFHVHIYPPRVVQDRSEYVNREPLFRSFYSKKESKLATAEDLIASMDRDGIELSGLMNISWTIPEFCTETNDYILESAARYPQRLFAFCSAPLESPEDAVKEIERCARGGARGIGEMRPAASFFDPANKEKVRPVIDALVRNRMMLLLHTSEPVGHKYPGKEEITPSLLYPFIESFPVLTLVCAHWGGGLPFYALMPEVKRALSNVYFDSAASPYLYTPQIYGQVASLAGADKVLFGSDYPLMPASRLLKEINNAGLDNVTRDKITSGNARRLLGLK